MIGKMRFAIKRGWEKSITQPFLLFLVGSIVVSGEQILRDCALVVVNLLKNVLEFLWRVLDFGKGLEHNFVSAC